MTIALELMSELVELAYPIKIREDPVVLELTEEEEEVIKYISGYIIHELRSRHSKAAEILSDVEPSGLVGQLTRGGLTNLYRPRARGQLQASFNRPINTGSICKLTDVF